MFPQNSLGACDGFIQPISYKRFDHFSLQIRQNALKKQWSPVTTLGEQLLGLNWKCPLSPITYKVGFWHFKSLCNRSKVSNKTYQYFCDKRLVRPGSKYPNWQSSQPISYKARFSHRDNIYLVDLKSNITYQNIRGETKAILIFIPSNA